MERGNIYGKKRGTKEKGLCQKQDTGALSASRLILIVSGSYFSQMQKKMLPSMIIVTIKYNNMCEAPETL